MPTIATAWVEILPSFKGGPASLAKQMGGANAGSIAGKEAGSGFAAKFKTSLTDIAKPLLALFAVDKVVEFTKASIEAGQEAQKTAAVTALLIKNAGTSAGVTVAGVNSLAASIGDTAGIARDTIVAAEQALLKFGNVKNTAGAGDDIFNRATKDATDLAAVTGKDLPASIALMGKALNNPGTGLGRLVSATGLALTAQLTASIKLMASTGNTLGAQKIILTQFEKQFGGAASASATAADRFDASMKNLKEDVGTALLPVVSAAENGLAKLGTAAGKAAEEGLSKVGDAFTALKGHDNAGLAKALGVGPDSSVVIGLTTLRDLAKTTYDDVVADFKAIAPGVGAAAKAFAGFALIVGGEVLAAVDGLAKVLRPVFTVLSATLNFLASHAGVFAGPVAGFVALALAVKAVETAMAMKAGLSAFTSGLTGAGSVIGKARFAMLDLQTRAGGVSNKLGSMGAAALSPLGLGAITGVAVLAGIAIDGIMQHYKDGHQYIQSFTDAYVADMDTIGAASKKGIADALGAGGGLWSEGGRQSALSMASEWGSGMVASLTHAMDGTAPSRTAFLGQLDAIIKAGQDSAVANARYGQSLSEVNTPATEAAANAQTLKDRYILLAKQQGIAVTAGDLKSASYIAEGLAADGTALATTKATTALKNATPATKALVAAQTALAVANKAVTDGVTSLNTQLDNMTNNYFELGDAKDAFQSAINAAVQAFAASKTGINGTSDAAIAARHSLESVVDVTTKTIETDVKHHASNAKIRADYQDQRAALIKLMNQHKLTNAQQQYYLDSLAHIPGVINTTVTILRAKQAEAQAKAYAKALAATIPPSVVTQINAKINYRWVPTRTGKLPVNSAATDSLLFQPEVSSKAAGGLITGPGGPRSDSVPLMGSAGEFMVNAGATARNLPLLQQINGTGYAAGGLIQTPAAAVQPQHVHVYIGSRELEQVVDARVDASANQMTTHLRYRAA